MRGFAPRFHCTPWELVERPSEIATAINAYLAHPQVDPVDAVVTGYDFLIDQAEAVSSTLATQGITVTPLISNDWTDDDFRATVEPGFAILLFHRMIGSLMSRMDRAARVRLNAGS